jgi:hypothetical protein
MANLRRRADPRTAASRLSPARRRGGSGGLEEPVQELVSTPGNFVSVDLEFENDGSPQIRDTPVAHAAERWITALKPLLTTPADPRTLVHWARVVGAAPGTLRNWCYTAGVSPRRSLVFARLFRAGRVMHKTGDSVENVLDIVDRRTIARLLRFGGFSTADALRCDVNTFLRRQTLVQDTRLLCVLNRELHTERQWR